MTNLRDLIADIGAELDGSVPSNLPFLIRSVEQELWQDLWFIAPKQEVDFTFGSGINRQNLSTQLTNPERVLFLESVIRLRDGVSLRRVSLSQFNRMEARGLSGVPEFVVFEPEMDLLGIYPVPNDTENVRLVVRVRPEPLNENSDETNNPMLGIGYEVLKWGVLYKRIFNPDKFQYWRLQFNEAFVRLQQAVMRKEWSYRGGTRYHDSEIPY